LPALARERVAIMPGMAEMIAARIAGMTLTSFLRHIALAAMGEALVLDGGGGLLAQRADEHAGQSSNPFCHRLPHGLLRVAICPIRSACKYRA
jgi:hypothetical protein